MIKKWIATAAMAAALSAAGAASASTVIYGLTVNGCSSTCFGSGVTSVRTVTGVGTNGLGFGFDLTNGAAFNMVGINGTHQASNFDLTGDTAVSISNIVAAMRRSASTGNADAKASRFGNFGDVPYRPAKGPRGTGGNSLDLTATGAAGSHLTFDAAEAQATLEADVLSSGDTGRVRAGGPSTSATPELAAWAMMLVGFGALGGLARRHRAALAKVSLS